ncbi:MAG TPA: tagaturonate epimerase family protein [Planctomycetota bacterium]|nr:tagaturonate epimerase family protein [Planctomycetota bacterium]
MSLIDTLLKSSQISAPVSGDPARVLAGDLAALGGFDGVYTTSIVASGGVVAFLGRKGVEKIIGTLALGGEAEKAGFQGKARKVEVQGKSCLLTLCAPDHGNALALRKQFPFLAPQTLGLKKSFGCGDRLGLATPGHLRAIKGSGFAPILAQQSIREMTRTQRTPNEVMDCATLGVFQEGWRDGFGSDADHLKNFDDVDNTVAAGFTMFTIDPGEHVDNAADTDNADTLQGKVKKLDWKVLDDTAAANEKRYVTGSAVDLGQGRSIPAVDRTAYLRAAAKYGKAVVHTVGMARHIAERKGSRPFEIEMSVDETQAITSPFEHYYVASELRRLGVRPVSLAPRLIGEFEKGVDYKGNLVELEEALQIHNAIAKTVGPYKLSLHSGSDKFSVYPIFSKVCGDVLHVKTAGTSYLEAVRAVGAINPNLFRKIVKFALERYDTDKKSYHVSADPKKVPPVDQMSDAELGSILDLFDGRQVLHVTFGSVLTTKGEDGKYLFREQFLQALREDEEKHYRVLARHIGRHTAPFAKA